MPAAPTAGLLLGKFLPPHRLHGPVAARMGQAAAAIRRIMAPPGPNA